MLSNSGSLLPTAPQVNMVAQTLVLHPKAPLPRDTFEKKQSMKGWPPNLHRDTKFDQNKTEVIDINLISKLMSQTGLEYMQEEGRWGF